MSKYFKYFFLLLVFIVVPFVFASHSWGSYHWARTANPFILTLGDNLSSSWKPYLGTTASDWSVSSVLDAVIVAGGTRPKNCRPTQGRVEVCNAKYGNNGWLGLAQIWVSGTHITQGITKLNDTYFSTPAYNTSAWRNLVMCQEVGHTLGLDHQDEVFDNPNVGTCMDYTNDPSTNQHPNAHDYEQLESIYTHLDSTTSVGQTNAKGLQREHPDQYENPSTWGETVRDNGRVALYARDLGAGVKLFTFVIWAR